MNISTLLSSRPPFQKRWKINFANSSELITTYLKLLLYKWSVRSKTYKKKNLHLKNSKMTNRIHTRYYETRTYRKMPQNTDEQSSPLQFIESTTSYWKAWLTSFKQTTSLFGEGAGLTRRLASARERFVYYSGRGNDKKK